MGVAKVIDSKINPCWLRGGEWGGGGDSASLALGSTFWLSSRSTSEGRGELNEGYSGCSAIRELEGVEWRSLVLRI